MCAISGLIGLLSNEMIEKKMLATMQHRGPDGRGVYNGIGCTMLHSRLAIIDPVGGQQPMKCSWNGEEFIIVYNGELYNTNEVRAELKKAGHCFKTNCDTEVVLHAFAQWREEALRKLNGIFAFAVWMPQRKSLFLARDRIGVKPLFYKIHNGGFIFASEIKTILSYPTVEPQLDAYGAAQLLMLGPGRMPGSGVFKDIQELEPGCYGYFESGKWTWKRYWRLQDREHAENFEDTVAHVKFLVTDAIKRQMVSDVPVGCFLSGGLDSSLITAVCAKEYAERGERVKTFSLDYCNNDKFFKSSKFQPEADTSYMALMSEYLNADSKQTVLTSQDLIENLCAATIARDLPGMADVDASLLAFCADIRKDVKVALSGECADEIFGGYPWYRDPEVRDRDGFPWAQNTKCRIDFLSPWIKAQIDPKDMVESAYKETLTSADILPGTNVLDKRMKQMVNLNHRWFMQTLLDRKDRISMHHGLEVRVPFCDYRIAEYLYAVPWEFKDYRSYEKGLLRQAMKDYLPERVLWRKKSPYPKTHDPAYYQMVRDLLKDILDDKNAPVLQIVNRNALETLMEGESLQPWYGQLMQIPQTIAYMLQINFWLKHYHVCVV